MAQEFVLSTPEFFGGIALVDPLPMPDKIYRVMGEEPTNGWKKHYDYLTSKEPLYCKDVEQNVLLYKSSGSNLESLEEFWKNASNAMGTGETQGNLTIYTGSVNPSAQLAVREITTADSYQAGWSDDIYVSCFATTRRMRNTPDSQLLPASYYQGNPNAKYYLQHIAGQEREWVEVLPSSYDGSKEYPLVIALHGSNNTGPQMYELTRLWEVAEARNFIVIFPTGSRTSDEYDLWNCDFASDKSNGNNDEDYLMDLIDYYLNNYKVDSTRVYLTGFSNGGRMTNAMAMHHADRFAAMMAYSGAADPDTYPMYGEADLNAPVWMNRGGIEYNKSNSIVAYGDDQFNYWLKRNNCGSEPVNTIVDGKFTTKVFQGDVEMRWTVRADAEHAIFPENYWDIWDNFFSRFQRLPDGSVVENKYAS